MIDLDSLIASSQDLAPLPESSTRLASLFGRDDWEVEDVAGILKFDAPLTGRILGYANSAASGAGVEIVDVDQALVRLGPGNVLRLAVGAAAKREFEASDAVFCLPEGALWRHSVAAALAIDQIGRVLRCPVPPEAFAAALLHDIGLVVLGRFLDEGDVGYLFHRPGSGQLSSIEAEIELLEVHHGEVGGLIASGWSLPESIVEAITHHHDPDSTCDVEWRQLADLVHVADAVACKIGCVDSTCGDGINATVSERLDISDEKFDELCERVEERFEDVLASYAC